MIRLRSKFRKEKDMIYISHLDLMRLFQRAFRRADIPVGYSEGFNPQPKLSFATALGLGIASTGEYMDIDLVQKIDSKEFIQKMNQVLPEGIEVLKAEYVEDTKSLMSTVAWSTYVLEIHLKDTYTKEAIQEQIDNLLEKKEIFITKTKKKKNRIIKREVDIRKYIKEIQILDLEARRLVIKTTLKTGSKGNLKPEVIVDELQKYLAIDEERLRIHRLELFVEKDNKTTTPL